MAFISFYPDRMGSRIRKGAKSRKAIKSRHNKVKKTRGGAVRGHGRFGCVVQPTAVCDPPIDLPPGDWVGKLVPISTRQTPSPNRAMRNAYPILGHPEFQRFQDTFATEYQKAEEIRRRVPHASDLFLLPEYECTVPTHEECDAIEPPFVQYFLRAAEGDLEQLFKSAVAPAAPTTQDIFTGLVGVAKSLQILHEHKIVHRDVKPTNVMWGMEEGRFWCKLADFGVAVFFPLVLGPALAQPPVLAQPLARSVSNSYSNVLTELPQQPLLRSAFAPTKTIPKLSLFGLRKNDPLVSERPPLPMSPRDFTTLEQLDWAGMLEILQYFFTYVGILDRPDILILLQKYENGVDAHSFLEDLETLGQSF